MPTHFWRICHDGIVRTLAIAVSGEKCIWYSGIAVRNWSPPDEIIRSYLHFTFAPHDSAWRQVPMPPPCNVRGVNQCTSSVHMRNSNSHHLLIINWCIFRVNDRGHTSFVSCSDSNLSLITLQLEYRYQWNVQRTNVQSDWQTDGKADREMDRERDWVVRFSFGWRIVMTVKRYIAQCSQNLHSPTLTLTVNAPPYTFSL